MAEKLDGPVAEIIRTVAPEVADDVTRLRSYMLARRGRDETPEDAVPTDMSMLLTFEHEGKRLTDEEISVIVRYVGGGFKIDTAGGASRTLTRPRVQAALHELTKDAIVRHQCNVDKVVRELVPLIGSNIADVVDVGPRGITVKDFSKLPRSVTAAVSEIHEVRNAQGTQIKVVLHDKIAAINSLTKLLGLNKEKEAAHITLELSDKLTSALERLQKMSPEREVIEGELVGRDDG